MRKQSIHYYTSKLSSSRPHDPRPRQLVADDVPQLGKDPPSSCILLQHPLDNRSQIWKDFILVSVGEVVVHDF